MKKRTKIIIACCLIVSMVLAATVFAFAQAESSAAAERGFGSCIRGGAAGENLKGTSCPESQGCKNDGICIGENCKSDGTCIKAENCKNDCYGQSQECQRSENCENRQSSENCRNRGNSNNGQKQRGNGACRNNG